MPTIRQGIYDLVKAVEVDTKEFGRVRLDGREIKLPGGRVMTAEPWPSQRIVVDAICRGLAQDVHWFAILKARQMAVTTICGIVEIFWMLTNPGIQGSLIADKGNNLQRLRRIMNNMVSSLSPEWRDPGHEIIQNNREGIAFANGSVADFLSAGTDEDLGASRAINLLHATECSLWRSLAGIESLKASLAQINPRRLFMFESIANGFNWFEKECQDAKRDRRKMFIFVGFWANPTYWLARNDPDYATYWDGSLSDEELQRARYVKQNYGYTIKPEQIAWYRREAESRAQEHMLRHYPWTERECFIASGSNYYPGKRLLEIEDALRDAPPLFKAYEYQWGQKFLDSEIVQTTDLDRAALRVWEPPEQGGVYAIGVDPSGGGGGESDNHSIEVLRCYADRAVQVAEFATNDPDTYQLAWALAHLAGCYRDHIINLEVTGVGAAVMKEIAHLRELADLGLMNSLPNSSADPFRVWIGMVRWFLYRRIDTMGSGFVYNWKTNQENKEMASAAFRDSLLLRRVELRSGSAVAELKAIVNDGGWIGAGGDTNENDDRVSGLILAHWAWVEWRRPTLIAQRHSYDRIKGERPPQNPGTLLSYAFSDFMGRLNQRKKPAAMRF